MWLPSALLLLWVPASTPVVPTTITIVTTLTVTTEVPTVPSTALSAVSATCSASIQDEPQKSFGPRLSLLLSLLAFLLLLLVGISLLAWRMFQKQVKAGEPPALSQGPRQAAPREEPHYTSVVFDHQSQGSNAHGISAQRPREKEPEYSVIRKK
uniref:CD300a molecule n=1 Tax=Propithecus coquereli TaxID=379532 RepID=A0A2K6FUN6_PROCO